MFNLTTHVRDTKTGQIIRVTDYRLVIENGNKKFERPVGSGYWYSESGELIAQPEAKVEAKEAIAEQVSQPVEAQSEAPTKPFSKGK